MTVPVFAVMRVVLAAPSCPCSVCASRDGMTYTPPEKLVAVAVANHMDSHRREAWPSRRILCAVTGLGTTSVREALRYLCEGEHALFERVAEWSAGRVTYRYRLLPEEHLGGARQATGGRQATGTGPPGDRDGVARRQGRGRQAARIEEQPKEPPREPPNGQEGAAAAASREPYTLPLFDDDQVEPDGNQVPRQAPAPPPPRQPGPQAVPGGLLERLEQEAARAAALLEPKSQGQEAHYRRVALARLRDGFPFEQLEAAWRAAQVDRWCIQRGLDRGCWCWERAARVAEYSVKAPPPPEPKPWEVEGVTEAQWHADHLEALERSRAALAESVAQKRREAGELAAQLAESSPGQERPRLQLVDRPVEQLDVNRRGLQLVREALTGDRGGGS